jgi:hypothetical protein
MSGVLINILCNLASLISIIIAGFAGSFLGVKFYCLMKKTRKDIEESES